MSNKIQVPCHWCGYGYGYDIMKVDFGKDSETRKYKKIFGMCGSCFHTTPVCHDLDELKSVVESLEYKKQEDLDSCLWCKSKNSLVHANVNRHFKILQHQGFVYPQRHQLKRFNIHYMICKKCQHCTPCKDTEQEARDCAENGSRFLNK